MAEEGRDLEEQMVECYKVKGKEEILNDKIWWNGQFSFTFEIPIVEK